MARLRPRRIAHHALLLLILAATAQGQGALTKFFRAGYYLSKTVDTLQIVKYDVNKATVGAWLDSSYTVTDTVTLSAGYYSFTSDTSNFYHVNQGGWASQQPGPAASMGHATGDWVLWKIGVSHGHMFGTTYLQQDTLYVFSANNTVIPRGSSIYYTYLSANSYNRTSEPRANERCQQVCIYYSLPSSGLSSAVPDELPAGTKVQVPLIFATGVTAQSGIDDDHQLVITATFLQKR